MEDNISLKDFIYQAIGEASMAWEPAPTGTFDTEAAERIAESIIERMRITLRD